MNTAPKRQILKISLVFSFLVGFLGLFGTPFLASAATITVTDTTGTDADNGLCSIVEAIQNANDDNQTASVDCEAGSGTDTISISVDINLNIAVVNGGGYTHTATDFITESVVIDGNDHEITNTLGNGLNFFGSLTAGVDISISDLTFADGDTTTAIAEEEGGAITLVGIDTLTLDNVTFDNNIADNGGAVYALSLTGGITVTNSYFTLNRAVTGNGGVFYLDDTDLTVTNSYFFNNRTDTTSGGVFYVINTGGTPILTIDKSTFEGNTGGNGGVFYIKEGVTLDITNSTFDNNDSIDDGGVIFSYQVSGESQNTVNVSHVTSQNNFSADSAGAFFLNCIFEGTCFGGSDFGVDSYFFENSILDGCDGILADAVFTNILGGATCGGSAAVTNISALADNGGSWKTFALSTGSNAIDTGVAGTLGCPATDERGTVRPSGVACDIGAFEFTSDVITLTEVGGTTDVTEDGATDTFTLELETYPTADVTITFDDGDELSASPTSVTFAQGDWPETKTVTVSAVDDNDDEDSIHTGSISFVVTSGDTGYNGYSLSSISVNISDNDSSSNSSGSSGNGGNNNPPPPPPPPSPIDPPPPVDEPIDDEEPPPPVDEPVEEEPLPEDPDDEPILPVDNDNEAPNDNQDGVGNENELPGRNDFEIRELPGLIAGAVVELVAEVPKEVADTISVIGVALPTIIFAISQPTVAANVISIPLRLSNLIPIWLGLRRKKRPWGTVYDSVTKQPLDPVYLTLKDSRGKVVATTITDLDGRFGFLVPPGRYKISAKKDDYVFPSRKLAGKTSDELYDNLYFGSDIEITGTESLVINNIAMDSTSFNWNEFEKAKNKRLMKFYSKRDVFLARIAEVSFWGGLVFSVALLFIGPGTLNYVLFGIYAFVLILRFLGVKPKKPGYVVETVTGFPLSFGLVRIFSAKLGKEVAHAIISKTGRYYALVPKGEYYLSIEKKVGEDEYKEVYKSGTIRTKKGFIGESFKV